MKGDLKSRNAAKLQKLSKAWSLQMNHMWILASSDPIVDL